MNAGDAAAWTAILVTLIIAVVGWIQAGKAGREARRAISAAERSAIAAEQSASAADRTVVALERMGDQWAESLSRAEKRDQRQWSTGPSYRPPPIRYETRGGGPWAGPPTTGPSEPVVHWTVDRIKGRQHQLRNLGRAKAYDVTLTSENAVRLDAPPVQDIDMGEAVEFLAIGSMQTGTPELIVRWRDSPDAKIREWRRPLP